MDWRGINYINYALTSLGFMEYRCPSGNDPLNFKYLMKLRQLADEFEPAWISDHLCWTGVSGINSHDLLLFP